MLSHLSSRILFGNSLELVLNSRSHVPGTELIKRPDTTWVYAEMYKPLLKLVIKEEEEELVFLLVYLIRTLAN